MKNKKGPNLKTTEQFIAEANAVFGVGTFDYSQVEYFKYNIHVRIRCPKHGVFYQIPTRHLQGFGCSSCGSDGLKTTLDEFIAKAKAIHGDKYNYDRVEYVNTKTPVEIRCSRHGTFYQAPTSHLRGRGCRQCGFEAISQNLRGKKKIRS